MRLFSFMAVVLAASFLSAADQPPKIKSNAPIPDGGYVDFSIDVPKGASVIWRISPAPVQRTTGLPSGRLIFGGKKGTTYTVTALVVDFDKKEVTDADYTFVFGGSPVVVDPPKKDPPVAPASGLYFLIVRPDGPATSQFTKTMGESAWGTLRKAGHLVKDFGVSEASKWVPAPDTLPAVYTLQETNGASKIVRGAIPLPTTSAAILDLPKGVK